MTIIRETEILWELLRMVRRNKHYGISQTGLCLELKRLDPNGFPVKGYEKRYILDNLHRLNMERIHLAGSEFGAESSYWFPQGEMEERIKLIVLRLRNLKKLV